jgi:preprotein translocase subunit SecE
MMGVRVPPGLPISFSGCFDGLLENGPTMLEKVREAPKNAVEFYGEVKNELRKVTWPGKNEVYGTTIVVIITVFFFGIYLFLVDVLLNSAVNSIFRFFQ